jgi:carotenoid cleavage dioxygenase-like enzyme
LKRNLSFLLFIKWLEVSANHFFNNSNAFIQSHTVLRVLLCTNVQAQKLADSTLNTLIHSNEQSKLQIQNLNIQVADLKTQLQKQERIGFDKFTNTILFLDAALSSANNCRTDEQRKLHQHSLTLFLPATSS